MSKFRDAIFTLASRINDFHKTHTIVHYLELTKPAAHKKLKIPGGKRAKQGADTSK